MLENSENVEVINKPMSISELYEVFTNAKACIAMRYHAIVMQTILNGNNIVLNYTNEKNGKISGFIKSLGDDFYSDRIINLQTISNWDISDKIEELDSGKRFNYKKSNMKKNYIEAVKEALGR